MLSLLPVVLLIIASLVIQLFGRWKLRPGTNWLISALVCVVVWVAIIPIGILLPSAVTLEHWLPEPFSFAGIVFQLTKETWIYGFLLLSLLVAVIFAEAKYLDSPGYINKLTGSMLISGIGLLAIMARSDLAFVLTWAMMDLVEFGFLAMLFGKPKSPHSASTSLVLRAAGILLLIVFMSLKPAGAAGISGAGLSAPLWGILIVLVTLRMGVLPLYFSYSEEAGFQHGMVTLFRVLPILSAFAFINLISGFGIPDISAGFLNTVLAIGVIIGSIAWFFASDELKGRPFWNFSLSILAVAAMITGRFAALTGIAVLLAISGPWLFLSSPRLRNLRLFLVILVLGILTIPFTPSASTSALFTGGGSILIRGLWIGSYSIMIAGFIKHGLRHMEEQQERESWMLLLHNIALYFLAFVPWIIVGVNFDQFTATPNWWPCLVISLLTAVFTSIYFLYMKYIAWFQGRFERSRAPIESLTHGLRKFISFQWFSRLLESVGFILEKIASLLSRVMEGDGGILWSFLFLVLLLSLLFTRQAP